LQRFGDTEELSCGHMTDRLISEVLLRQPKVTALCHVLQIANCKDNLKYYSS